MFDLRWRTGHGSIGAEHATIATLGLQFGAAAGAFVEIPASVGRHRFHFRGTATRTDNDRLKDHSIRLFGAEKYCVRCCVGEAPNIRFGADVARGSNLDVGLCLTKQISK